MIEQAHQHQPNEVQRHRLATITVERPRCPACGDVRLRKYRSIRVQGGGCVSLVTRAN